MELKNKNVFVTGSTRGIGLAVAHKFASLGANVVLNGRSEISEDLLAQFADYGVTVVGISGDISNGEDAKRMVACLENQLDWCLQYDTSCLETNV